MMNKSKETRFVVTEPMELMEFLLIRLSGKGRNYIKGLLSRGQISVEGKTTTKYNHPLESGQHVMIHGSRTDKQEHLGGVQILYEDADLVVIDKPSGLLSIASHQEKTDTAYHYLMEHVKKVHPRDRIFVVHRLDRDTSGVMLYAKNEKVKQLLQNSWKESVLDRRYAALVEGGVPNEAGTVTSWLKESKTFMMYSSPTPNGGQKAVTHYKILRRNDNYSLLEVKLETGRKNQIRVHMQVLGHSIVGDKKYGSTQNPIGRLGLHAMGISFHHPVTGELLSFETQIPDKFLRVFK